MNEEKILVIIKGEDKTKEIEYISETDNKKINIKFKNEEKIYKYNEKNIIIKEKTEYIDFKDKEIYYKNQILFNVQNAIRFDKFIKGSKKVEIDCNTLSEKGVMTFDLLFNILYKNGVFHIIDTCDYEFVDKDSKKLYRGNIKLFNYSLLEFLVKDRFYKFVFTSKELSELYKEAENGESIIPFLEMLRQRLSEYCDKDVKVVRDAKKAMTLCHKSVYPEYF